MSFPIEATGWMAWVFWEAIGVSGVPRRPDGPDIDGALAALVERAADTRLKCLLGKDGALWGVIVMVDEALQGSDLPIRALAASILADPYGVAAPFVDMARAEVLGERSLAVVSLPTSTYVTLSAALDREAS